jgi:hypothetical protein
MLECLENLPENFFAIIITWETENYYKSDSD